MDRRRRVAWCIVIAVAAIAVAALPAVPEPAKVTVALLPLDADARLALYGQPVAAEVERALVAEGLDVALVGQGDPVPTRAVLVVDGQIRRTGKSGPIALHLRIRDPAKGEVLAKVSATAASLTAIDKAAADVAQKLVPEVRAKLAARQPPPPPEGNGAGTADKGSAGGNGSARPPIRPSEPARPGILLVARSRVPLDGSQAAAGPEAMVAAVAPAFERMIVGLRHRPVAPVAPIDDRQGGLAAAIRGANAAFAISIDIERFSFAMHRPTRDGDQPVPTARVRARVQIVGADGTVRFDRIIRTDTLVGQRGDGVGQLAGYAGAQIADVVRLRVGRATGGP